MASASEPGDRFNDGEVDKRLIDQIPIEIWQLTLSYLEVTDVLPNVPPCCKFLDEVTWGPWSAGLLWREMSSIGLDATSFSDWRLPWRSQNQKIHNVLHRAVNTYAPLAHIRKLSVSGIDVNAVDMYGRTALYVASELGRSMVVRMLLASRADPMIESMNGLSPLTIACTLGRLSVIKALVKVANIDHVDECGDTALIMACNEGRLASVRLLLDARADPTIRGNRNKTALDVARAGGRTDIIAELLKSTQ